MTRSIWLDWSRRFDFVDNLTLGGTTFQVNASLLNRYRKLFGIYMLLEDTNVEPARRAAIESWRGTEGLTLGGAHKVVYIGIVKSDQRDFVQRMREHHKAWIYKYSQSKHLYVKFSECQYTCSDAALPQLIEDAESVLVWALRPYENTAKTRSFRVSDEIVVRNSGHHAPLPSAMHSANYG